MRHALLDNRDAHDAQQKHKHGAHSLAWFEVFTLNVTENWD